MNTFPNEASMIIVVDTREQEPYKFKKYETITKKLDYGDYSIIGYEDVFGIERKSLSDFVSSISTNREAFKLKMNEASKLDYFALLIETDMTKIWKARLHSKMHRTAIVNTAIKWSVKFDMPIFFGSNRSQSQYIVQSLCEAFFFYQSEYDNESKRTSFRL